MKYHLLTASLQFHVTDVWLKHYWRSYEMAWIRRVSCEPLLNEEQQLVPTYNSLCTVPISNNETEWCIANYNSTACTDIRNSAQERALNGLLIVYNTSGAVGVLLTILVRQCCHPSQADSLSSSSQADSLSSSYLALFL